MGLETTPSRVSDLDNTWPLATDTRHQGDNQIRNIKAVLNDVLQRMIGTEAETELTLDTNGLITPIAGVHSVDTFGDAATDDLEDIAVTNFLDNSFLFLRLENAARVVTVVDSGNIVIPDSTSFELTDTKQYLLLRRNGANWDVLEQLIHTPRIVGGTITGSVISALVSIESLYFAAQVNDEDLAAAKTLADSDTENQHLNPGRTPRVVTLPSTIAYAGRGFHIENDNPLTSLGAFTAGTNNEIALTAAHGLANGDRVRVASATTLPVPLEVGVDYFIVSLVGDTCKLAFSAGGTEVDITTTGTGTHTCYMAGWLTVKGADAVIVAYLPPGAHVTLHALDIDDDLAPDEAADWKITSRSRVFMPLFEDGTFVVPYGVTTLDVILVGGGGVGGRQSSSGIGNGAGGGGGGDYHSETIGVAPADSLAYAVGASGESSTFGVAIARAGAVGGAGTTGVGGVGTGSGADGGAGGVGGGAGKTARGTGGAQGSNSGGGGGGASWGNGATGGNGSANDSGDAALDYSGGGGGGGGRDDTSGGIGGAGGSGRIQLRF